MQHTINEALASLDENTLIEQYIIPLTEQLHPGRIEFTHSSIEAGRDIVSFGRDYIGRDHILCIQVKAKQVSFGASSELLRSSVKLARTMGITLQNGIKCFPHEVWLITSHTFPEQQRRQVADVLQEFERMNIKFIPGEELCNLLIEHLPKQIAILINAPNASVVELISSLNVHSEARAFGLTEEKKLEQFYVTATLSIDCDLAYQALANAISFRNLTFPVKVPIKSLPNIKIQTIKGKKYISSFEGAIEAVCEEFVHSVFVKDYNIPLEIKKVYPIQKNNAYVVFDVIVSLKDTVLPLLKSIKEEIKCCPKELKNNATKISKTWLSLRHLNHMMMYVQDQLGENAMNQRNYKQIDPLRIRLTRLRDLVNLEKIILVEGPPGCGKTTLLRMLTTDLLKAGSQAFYLQCFRIPRAYKRKSLVEIVRDYAQGAASSKWKPQETNLIIDGLDEGSFDISQLVEQTNLQFNRIVLSSRTAFASKIRSQFASLTVSPFTEEERNLFFRLWFEKHPDHLITVKKLVDTYPDIAVHTTVPLVATILVALIESGFSPKSRAEIYNQRLELLLSRWDRCKGVSRTKIDNPDAKRRLLRQLAFNMQGSDIRKRTFRRIDMQEAFENALGNWGYNVDLSQIINDLTLAHGVLVEDQPGVFSFGHLTFQEHLAGEYIAKNLRPPEIADFLGMDWWRESLNFYASIASNISEFLEYVMENDINNYRANAKQLLEMVEHAPYTSPGALSSLKQTLNETAKDEDFLNGYLKNDGPIDELG